MSLSIGASSFESLSQPSFDEPEFGSSLSGGSSWFEAEENEATSATSLLLADDSDLGSTANASSAAYLSKGTLNLGSDPFADADAPQLMVADASEGGGYAELMAKVAKPAVSDEQGASGDDDFAAAVMKAQLEAKAAMDGGTSGAHGAVSTDESTKSNVGSTAVTPQASDDDFAAAINKAAEKYQPKKAVAGAALGDQAGAAKSPTESATKDEYGWTSKQRDVQTVLIQELHTSVENGGRPMSELESMAKQAGLRLDKNRCGGHHVMLAAEEPKVERGLCGR